MLKYIITGLLSSSVLFVAAQLSFNLMLYKTYDDYVNRNGVELEGDVISFSMGKHSVFKTKMSDGTYKIKKIYAGDYYAISEKNNFFRIDNGYPLHIVNIGQLVYYEDGNIALRAAWGNSNEGTVLREGCWFSDDLHSEAFTYKKRKSLKLMKEEKPEMTELIDCVLKNSLSTEPRRYMPAIRECVRENNNVQSLGN